MLTERVVVALLLLPIGVGLIALGGWSFALVIALILGTAAWEYVRLFRKAGAEPAGILVIAGVALLAIARKAWGMDGAGALLAGLMLLAMAYHLWQYERGRDSAATDMGVTLGGLVYLGWLGAYLISLRELPDGKWWILVALPAVWAADIGAYFIGRRFGRRKFSPRLSPKKTWEGYWGGVAAGLLGGALLGIGFGMLAPQINLLNGAILGLTLGIFTPLGDLGESMIKRQAGAKDASHIIPGHGGVMDRIDTWLWAGVLSYYLIIWLI